MPDPAKPQRFSCPACSADMEFDPASANLKCRYCGHEEPVASQPSAAVHPLDQALAQLASRTRPLSPQAIESTCDTCGSVVAFEPPEVAGSCPFCGSALVAEPKAADPLIAPDAVLPAKIPKTAAQSEVRQWLATRWFAPNALQRLARQEGIGGVYLPFWTYAAATQSDYAGQRGEHYYQTESYTETDNQGNSVERTRQVQHTRWYPSSGRVARTFDNVLIPATRAVKESRLNALQPWDLAALRPYEPAYLAGFKAQRYQIELPQGFETAKQVMAAAIEQDVRKDIGGDEQRVDTIETQYSGVTFRHLLLPVWIGAYQFQSKTYQVVVNACTGQVQGERPYSAAKIIVLVVGIFLVIILIFAMTAKQ